MSEEEIIKNIKEVIYTNTGEIMNYIDIDNLTSDNECDTFIKAIEEILDSYNNLKQIEQEHQKINGELREELKRERKTSHFLQSQLDIANANIIHLKIAKEEAEELLENSVSKDKIREKIEEVKSIENVSIADILEDEKEFCIDILEELL